VLNAAPVAPRGAYVLYWMVSSRRLRANFALERAVDWAQELKKPLLVFEALRCGYRWASDRLHRFVLDGMAEHRRSLASGPASYYAYVEPSAGAGKDLLRALASRAVVVITDEYPCFMLPRMVAAGAGQSAVRVEAVDANGLVPLRAAEKVFSTAHAFRRFLQRALPEHLEYVPAPAPLGGLELPVLRELPRDIQRRWPEAPSDVLAGGAEVLAALPIDHSVAPSPLRGGERAGQEALRSDRASTKILPLQHAIPSPCRFGDDVYEGR
jgi:deoxyribodipyrimidine photo-lyase